MVSRFTLIRQLPVGSGGAEAYIEYLAKALAVGGAQVQIVCADAPEEGFYSGLDGVDIVRLDPSRTSQWRWLRPWYFPWLVKRWLIENPQPLVLSLDRNWHQDILRAGEGVHAEWLERRGKQSPTAAFLSALSPFHRLMLWSEKRAFDHGRTGWVMANSQFVKEQIVSRFGFPHERVGVIHNGIPLEKWPLQPDKGQEIKQRFGLAQDDFLGLFVGAGWERKGLSHAIQWVEAFRSQTGRAAKLIVVGRGPEKKFCHPQAVFLGKRERSALQELYAGADALLLPTIYDPFANVTLEALACGLPVITLPSNGASEIISEGVDGVVIPSPEDIDAAVSAMSLFSRVLPREKTRLQCRSKAEQFNMGRHIGEVLALCGKVRQCGCWRGLL